MPTLLRPGRNGRPVGELINWYMVPLAVFAFIRLWLEHPTGAIIALACTLGLGALFVRRGRDIGVYATDEGVEVVNQWTTRCWRWPEVAAFDYQRLHRGPGFNVHVGEVVLRDGERRAMSSIVGTSQGRGVADDQGRQRIRELNANLAHQRPEPEPLPWEVLPQKR